MEVDQLGKGCPDEHAQVEANTGGRGGSRPRGRSRRRDRSVEGLDDLGERIPRAGRGAPGHLDREARRRDEGGGDRPGRRRSRGRPDHEGPGRRDEGTDQRRSRPALLRRPAPVRRLRSPPRPRRLRLPSRRASVRGGGLPRPDGAAAPAEALRRQRRWPTSPRRRTSRSTGSRRRCSPTRRRTSTRQSRTAC